MNATQEWLRYIESQIYNISKIDKNYINREKDVKGISMDRVKDEQSSQIL